MPSFDLIVLGSGLSGLLTGCQVLAQGGSCLWIPHPGPWENDFDFPVFSTQKDDIWDLWFQAMGMDVSSADKAYRSEGDPALTYISPNLTLTFQHTSKPRDILMAHNAFLPHNFFQVFNSLYDQHLKNEFFLKHHLWENLLKKDHARPHSHSSGIFTLGKCLWVSRIKFSGWVRA